MSQLFSPFTLANVTMRNRVVVSPMSQYRAMDGHANDWHLVHLGRFALGGAGLVFVEATAVQAHGRRTHGDLGIWDDAHIAPLARVCRFLEDEGSVPGIQLGHAGRKASERRPWHGESPVNDEDTAQRGEPPWPTIAPSALPFADPWPVPAEMTEAQIEEVIAAFRDAARRSREAGFRVIEVYAAHGFLLHQFYSPIANRRGDQWGGSLDNRCRMAVRVAEAIRKEWPAELPLIFRLSATDWMEGGWTVEDTVHLAKLLKSSGVDMIDCSTGGIGGMGGRERPALMPLAQNFQVPFAAEVKREADMPTMAVGLIWDADAAERIIAEGEADMIAMARELLDHPNWPLQAMARLGADERFAAWPPESGWWLDKRERLCKKLDLR
ncbi:MAG: NADH:flavin oxidoreductase/NADH oxidase [Pseudomonadota bacterium]